MEKSERHNQLLQSVRHYYLIRHDLRERIADALAALARRLRPISTEIVLGSGRVVNFGRRQGDCFDIHVEIVTPLWLGSWTYFHAFSTKECHIGDSVEFEAILDNGREGSDCQKFLPMKMILSMRIL